jgi:dihydrofolate reductase
MRKLNVLTFVSLDGVMQAPGGPHEDPTGNFQYEGWVAPLFDEVLGEIMGEQTGQPFDLLLGRKTYEIFAAHWPYRDESEPFVKELNRATKYVASRSNTSLEWENSVLVSGDVPAEIKKIKAQDGPDIQVHGSANLIQTLLKHDLVDEFWLKIFPVVLGKGKRLFGDGTVPAAFTLSESQTTPNGVIAATYVRAGEVQTGDFGNETPSERELARREKMKAES